MKEILTAYQKALLQEIGASPLSGDFYLTGGTALSAFYLFHRYSEDLDFFTPDPNAVVRVAPVLQAIAASFGARVSFTRMLGTFLECFIEDEKSGQQVKMDFAYDTPFRLKPTIHNAEYGIEIDNATDIACNKLSALFDRAEPKDFVDVYFVCQELMPFKQLLALARQKHVGIDDYWLAVALQQARDITLLPRMVKPLDLTEMQAFFLTLAHSIMDNLEAGQTS